MLLAIFIKRLVIIPYLLESKEFEIFMSPATNDFSLALKGFQVPDQQSPVDYLESMSSYCRVQGTYSDEEMYDYFKTVTSLEKQTKIMLKQLEAYISTIAEAEKRFDRNNQKFKELNKLFYEFEELSLETY